MSDLTLKVISNKESSFVKLDTKSSPIYFPFKSLSSMEIIDNLNTSLTEVSTGDLKLNAWTNPDIQSIQLNDTEKVYLSYLMLLSFLGVGETRDIWLNFKQKSPKTLTYLRERSHFSGLIFSYKVSILKCLSEKLGSRDIDRIKMIFAQNDLSPDNYLLYLIFVMSGDYRKLSILHREPYVLSVAAFQEELDEFVRHPSTMAYCMSHAATSLRFITQSTEYTTYCLASELLMNTMVAYQLARPAYDTKHAQNYARRCMTNTVNRIIQAFTHYEQKIGIWVNKQTNGFIHRFTSLDTMVTVPEIDSSFDHNFTLSSLHFNEDVAIRRIDEQRLLV